MPGLPEEFYAAARARRVTETPVILWVSVPEQALRVFVHGQPAAQYPVSTAQRGVGCRRDSLQTPVGLHRVAQKIGDGQPTGTIFIERQPAVCSDSQSSIRNPQSDLILTRILWLEGLQPGINQGGEVDTFSRYIYIHGTNHEEQIGQPASHGCVRMRNQEVLELFALAEVGTLVWIG
jgi:lipoprotein-anchoring transpeptidase ErfK/SrfK